MITVKQSLINEFIKNDNKIGKFSLIILNKTNDLFINISITDDPFFDLNYCLTNNKQYNHIDDNLNLYICEHMFNFYEKELIEIHNRKFNIHLSDFINNFKLKLKLEEKLTEKQTNFKKVKI